MGQLMIYPLNYEKERNKHKGANIVANLRLENGIGSGSLHPEIVLTYFVDLY
jgi:hypothetical protein